MAPWPRMLRPKHMSLFESLGLDFIEALFLYAFEIRESLKIFSPEGFATEKSKHK